MRGQPPHGTSRSKDILQFKSFDDFIGWTQIFWYLPQGGPLHPKKTSKIYYIYYILYSCTKHEKHVQMDGWTYLGYYNIDWPFSLLHVDIV